MVIGHDLFETEFYCNSFQDVPNKALLRKEKNFRKIENKTFFTNLHAFFFQNNVFSLPPQNLKMQINLEIHKISVNFGCAVACTSKVVFVKKHRFHK